MDLLGLKSSRVSFGGCSYQRAKSFVQTGACVCAYINSEINNYAMWDKYACFKVFFFSKCFTRLNFDGEVTILILFLKVILHLILKYYQLLSLQTIYKQLYLLKFFDYVLPEFGHDAQIFYTSIFSKVIDLLLLLLKLNPLYCLFYFFYFMLIV